MIELFAEKKDCCGCGACMNICPKTAIHMEKDEYGFVYPKIDTEKCVECGACKKVCAFQNEPTRKQPQRVYAIASKNNDLEKNLLRVVCLQQWQCRCWNKVDVYMERLCSMKNMNCIFDMSAARQKRNSTICKVQSMYRVL